MPPMMAQKIKLPIMDLATRRRCALLSPCSNMARLWWRVLFEGKCCGDYVECGGCGLADEVAGDCAEGHCYQHRN